MFDFMKDIYLEMNGLDVAKAREERKVKLEKEKSETVIFNKKTKRFLLIAGVFFLLLSGGGLALSINRADVFGIVKNALLLVAVAVTMVCLIIKKRETEIASIVGMALIILITFIPQAF